MRPDLETVIAACGGVNGLVERLAQVAAGRPMNRGMIYAWRTRSIVPPSWHTALMRVARDVGVDLDLDDVERMGRPGAIGRAPRYRRSEANAA